MTAFNGISLRFFSQPEVSTALRIGTKTRSVSKQKWHEETSTWRIWKPEKTAEEQVKQQIFLLENGCMHSCTRHHVNYFAMTGM